MQVIGASFTFAVAMALCGVTAAQDLSALTGTIGIEADTMTRHGQFAGCTLNYRAAVQDYTYRTGALTGVSGSFTLELMRDGAGQKAVGALLKVGLKQVAPAANLQNEAPEFAYLATAHGSTAKSVVASDISETPGYRLFALKVDEALVALIGDILDGSPVTLYYSRTADGLDVKVPLDMKVIDTKPSPTGLERVRSEETLRSFDECFQRLGHELR